MNEDEQLDLKWEKQVEQQEEAAQETLMHADLDYCLEQLGLDDIRTDIRDLELKLFTYGHDVSLKYILDKLEEI